MNLPSSTFCVLPWMHISTRPNGHMRVCCTANASGVQRPESMNKILSEAGVLQRTDGKPANLATTSFSEAWNNDYMKNIRLAMLRGDKPASCLKCFKEEEAGHRSKRNWENNKWINELGLDDIIGSTAEDGSISPKIRYLDLRLGSKCQLACIMCSPHDSSGWIKEYNNIYPTLSNDVLIESMAWEKNTGKLAWAGGSYAWHKKNPRFWEELYDLIPNLRQLYWAGGESLIMQEHYQLLEYIIEKGYAAQMELRYNSNGVEWQDNLFELWKHFKKVIFHFSIDAYGSQNEYMRYPSKWKKIVYQLKRLDNYPYTNLTLTTATTITALNIFYIPEFINWKMNEDWKILNKWPLGAGIVNMHFAYWPQQLNVKILPKWFKSEVALKYKEFYPYLEANWKKAVGVENVDYDTWRQSEYGIKRLQGLISFMQAEDWSTRLPEFKEWNLKVSSYRNLDFVKIFPDLEWIYHY